LYFCLFFLIFLFIPLINSSLFFYFIISIALYYFARIKPEHWAPASRNDLGEGSVEI